MPVCLHVTLFSSTQPDPFDVLDTATEAALN